MFNTDNNSKTLEDLEQKAEVSFDRVVAHFKKSISGWEELISIGDYSKQEETRGHFQAKLTQLSIPVKAPDIKESDVRKLNLWKTRLSILLKTRENVVRLSERYRYRSFNEKFELYQDWYIYLHSWETYISLTSVESIGSGDYEENVKKASEELIRTEEIEKRIDRQIHSA